VNVHDTANEKKLSINTRTVRASQIIELAGELDIGTVGEFREQLEHTVIESGQQLVLDLAGVRFCDSSGLTALLVARTQALTSQGRLALTAIPTRVARTLQVAGLEPVFSIHTSTDDAIADWERHGSDSSDS
jgi:anti-sigma B factor antagonist